MAHLAAAAEEIVAANGLSELIQIIPKKSSESSIDERADILVCEIFDNCLLGEGALASISDARARLLKPGSPHHTTRVRLRLTVMLPSGVLSKLRAGGMIIPGKGRIWCAALELRYAKCGTQFDLDELNILNCDDSLAVSTQL